MRSAIPRSGLLISIVGLAAAAFLTGEARAGSASTASTRTLVVYSVANAVQFINNADDEARGVTNNPFDAATNKLRPEVSEKGNGPFPGDVAVYSFDLFSNASLSKSAGSAAYTCYYNYAKRALCMAYYELAGPAGTGTVLASGPVDFNQTQFKLIVTGGTKQYLGASGEVSAVAAATKAQRLHFLLVG